MYESAIAIVIPNWNGMGLLRDCLHSLERQTVAHEVIVVDNGSVDQSNELVRNEFPEVQLLEFLNNAGFAGGVNRGIWRALEQQAKYIVLLNNDAIANEHWLEELVAMADADARVGIVAAKILTLDGKRIDSAGDFYSIWGFPFPRGRGEVDSGQYDSHEQRDVFGASGGASLYRAQMLREIGLFDERFFAYFEDVDISFRARLAGWKIRYNCEATVRHHIGGTSSRLNNRGLYSGGPIIPNDGHAQASAFTRYHTVKNFSYVYTKNMPGYLYWKYLPRFWSSVGMMLVSDLVRGMLVWNLKACLMALLHFPAVLRDRWKIQSMREVTLAEIDRQFTHELPPMQRVRFKKLGLMRSPRQI